VKKEEEPYGRACGNLLCQEAPGAGAQLLPAGGGAASAVGSSLECIFARCCGKEVHFVMQCQV